MNTCSLLLLSDQESGFDPLRGCLSELGYTVECLVLQQLDLVDSRALSVYGLIVFNIASISALHHSILQSIQQNSPRPIVMFSGQSDAQAINAAIQAGAHSIVIDEVACQRIAGIIEIARARFAQCTGLQAELSEARQQLSDRVNIDRAKRILMQRKGMDEAQAYRFLRKTAMDNKRRIADVASRFIAFETELDPSQG